MLIRQVIEDKCNTEQTSKNKYIWHSEDILKDNTHTVTHKCKDQGGEIGLFVYLKSDRPK